MLDWISDAIYFLMTSIPAFFVEQGSPTFYLFRAMFGLIFIVLIVGALAFLQPYWPGLRSKIVGLFARKRNRGDVG
jgi:hypothetical protein